MKGKDQMLGTTLADSVQGHVGQNTKQVFSTLNAVPFAHDALKIQGYEFLMHDQFGNYYLKSRALLMDGELYDADTWLKPSRMRKHGGGHSDTEKHRLRITESLLREVREENVLALGRANLEIIKARSLSQSPVAIETRDITHQANVLEDKITQESRLASAEADLAAAVLKAKQAAGEAVPDEQSPAGFAPVTKLDRGDLKAADTIHLPMPPVRPKTGA